MIRRQIARQAFDAEHKALLLKVRHARGLARVRALNALRDYMLARLREAK